MNVVTFSFHSIISGKPQNKEEVARLKRILHEQEERESIAQRESQKQPAE